MKKEVRDLLRDRKLVVGMIVVPLFIFPLLGAAINLSTQSALTASQSSSFGMMNLDGGNYSKVAFDYFTSLPNVTVRMVPSQSIDAGMKSAQAQGVSTLVVIPEGFSSDIAARRQATLQTYTTVTGFGIANTAGSARLSSVVGSFGTYLAQYYVRTAAPGLNYSVIVSPLALNESTFLNGELLAAPPSVVVSTGLSQSFALPIATFVVVIFAMQIASTAMAVEKEQKTFETLLTLPVSRFQVLASKLVGSTVIAAMGAVASIIGFTYYYSVIISSSIGSASLVNLAPSLTYYAVLGVLLFLTLTLATALAIIVSVFSTDVRGAQAVVGYLAFPIMVPSFIVILGDFNSLSFPIQAAVLAIPFSYVAVFSSAGLFGQYTYALLGMGYLVLWIVAALYIASRLFSSERVLTARFSFGRRKKSSPAA